MKKIFLSLLTIIFFIACSPLVFSLPDSETSPTPAAVSTPAAPETIFPTLSKPHVYTLPDGLTIIVEEDHTAPIATVQAWCATGSIHEGAHLGAGLSHILEHMLFKGTTHRPPGAIAEEVRRQGGYVNANTSFYRTIFYIDVPSTGVASAVDILADMMMNATLPIPEYQKEQEVIRREFAMRADDPSIACSELLYRAAFRVSPLREPIIGRLDIYNKLTRDEVIAYYKQRYAPNNICFVIVGDVDAEKVRKQLTALSINYPYRVLEPVVIKKEPPQLTKRVARETFPMKQSFLDIGWKVPDYRSTDAPAVEVLATLLASGRNSLLNQELHEKKDLVYSIGAEFEKQACLISIGAAADPQKREAAEAEILHQIDLLKIDGATQAEVERAKKLLLGSHFHALENVDARASAYGNSWLATGDPCYQEDFFKAIERVTPKEVNQVAKKYLVEDTLTITSLDPKPASGPAKNENAEKKIQQSTTNTIKKFTLPNGLRLLIHEDHRLPLVAMAALFRGGLMTEGENKSGLTELLARTITKGTHSKNAEQITQALEQVGGTMSAGAGTDSFGIYVNVMKPDFKLGFDLLADVLTAPIFPSDQVDREKKNQLADIKTKDDQIMTTAFNLLQKKLFGTHPYSRCLLGTPESVAMLTPETLKEYSKQLVVGKNGVVAIFGDVQTEEVLAIATKAFATLPSGALALQSVPAPTPLTTPLHDQAEQEREQSIVMKGFLGANITSPDCPALELLSAACNGWGSRFFKEMRDKKSLAYLIKDWNMTGLASGDFIFYLGADPKKSTIAREELDREIKELIQTGLTQEELEQAKKIVLKNDALTHQSNANFGNKVASDELMGLGFEHDQHHSDEINEVTLEQVNRIIKKYLGAPGSVEVVVGPNMLR